MDNEIFEMDVSKAIHSFITKAGNDSRLGVSHISIYMALLDQFYLQDQKGILIITRVTLMHSAKLRSRHTYNKCMHDLHELGYIVYSPSSKPAEGSKVQLVKL